MTNQERKEYRTAIIAAGGSIIGASDAELLELFHNIDPRRIPHAPAAEPTPKPAPAAEPTPAASGGLDAIIGDIVRREILKSGPSTDDAKNEIAAVGSQVLKELGNVTTAIQIELDKKIAAIKTPTLVTIKKPASKKASAPKVVHYMFKELLDMVSYKENLWITGPAGAGKTYCTEQIADALGIDFYSTGRVSNSFELLGYMDANGGYVETAFYKAFTRGGLFLFDEIDASAPEAITSFNAALSGSTMAFPCGMKKAHKDFFAVANANTSGNGASRQYVSRTQLDGASLDRFIMVHFDYDEALELALAPCAEWCAIVQKYRRAADELNLNLIISPRAVMRGALYRDNVLSLEKMLDYNIFKGAGKDTINKLNNHVKEAV